MFFADLWDRPCMTNEELARIYIAVDIMQEANMCEVKHMDVIWFISTTAFGPDRLSSGHSTPNKSVNTLHVYNLQVTRARPAGTTCSNAPKR